MIYTRNNNISTDQRWKFQLRMRPIADKLYYAHIPNLCKIERPDWRNDSNKIAEVLDRDCGIDVKLHLSNGMKISMQEKFREHSSYKDVTVEYKNDPILDIDGDWFTMMAQVYFDGFATKDEQNFERWVLLDWLQCILETQKGNIKWGLQKNKPPAKASFVYALMESFPANCIIASNIKVGVFNLKC